MIGGSKDRRILNPFNPRIEAYLEFKAKGGVIRVTKREFFVNKELFFPRKADSYGYIRSIRPSGTPGIYFVRTTDSGDMEIEVLLEEESPVSASGSNAEQKEAFARKAYFSKLRDIQTASEPFPLSTALPNTDLLMSPETLDNLYSRMLEPYQAASFSPDKQDYRKDN